MQQVLSAKCGQMAKLWASATTKVMRLLAKSSFVAGSPGTRYVEHVLVHEHAIHRLTVQYDSNAIRVDNVLYNQIGHLPRKVAEKIAPYMVWIPRQPALNSY